MAQDSYSMSSVTSSDLLSTGGMPEAERANGENVANVSGSESDPRHKSDTPHAPPSRGFALLIALISLIAIGITSYLAVIAVTSSQVAGCGGGALFDCNDVIKTRWSRWLGIPVSILALGLYGSLFASAGISSLRNIGAGKLRMAWAVVVLLGLSAGMAAVWFIGLQVFVVKHLCIYCLAAHACGLVVTGILLWKRPFGGAAMRGLALLSLLGFGVLVAGQLAVKPVTYKVIEHEAPAQGEETVEPEIFEFTPPGFEPVETPIEEKKNSEEKQTGELLNTEIDQKQRNGNESNASVSRPSTAGQELTQTLLALMSRGNVVQYQVATGESSRNTTEKKQQRLTAVNAQAAEQERRFASISGGTIKLDVAQWPIIGKQDAKYVFVEMFDYTCEHCRRTHAAVAGAKQQLGDDLAIIVLPVPLNTRCNSEVTVTGPTMAEACEISQLAVAVWRVQPEKLTEFHEFLMTTPAIVTYAEARAKADTLVDPDALKAELAKPTAGQYIAQHVALYKRVGAGNVPKLMFPGTTVVGEFTSPNSLVEIIKTQLK